MPASAWRCSSEGVVVRTPGMWSTSRVIQSGFRSQLVLRSPITLREGSSPSRGRRSCAPLLS